MGYSHLHVVREDGVVWLELSHGKANECGSEIIAELNQLAAEIEQDSSLRCLVMWSQRRSRSGKPIFVAGANVTERRGWSDDRVKEHVRYQRATLLRLRALPVFTITIVNGLALGLGTELLLAADYRIALPEARCALPETGLGIVPGALGSALLASQIGVAHALRMGMTGEQIDAPEALRIGLVQELAEDLGAARTRAAQMAARVALKSPRAVATYKRTALAALGRDEPSRVALEATAYDEMVDSGEAAIGRAHFEAIRKGQAPPWPPRS